MTMTCETSILGPDSLRYASFTYRIKLLLHAVTRCPGQLQSISSCNTLAHHQAPDLVLTCLSAHWPLHQTP